MTARRARIVEASDRPPEEWDRLAVGSPAGHAFQSHAWGELKRPLGWSVRRFLIEDDSGPRAAVSLQVRGLLAGTYAYAPRGPVLVRPVAGGGGTGTGDTIDEGIADDVTLVAEGLREIARAVGALVLTVDPAWPIDGDLAAGLRAAGFTPAARQVQVSRTAMIVPVLGDEREQHRLVRKSTANLINRARREGAVAQRIDLRAGTPDDTERALGTMHDLLSATARREGIVLRDRAYQLAQWRALGAAGNADLWFARVTDRPWAGSLLLRCGETLVQYQAGSADDADLHRIPANHLLQWHILRWAAGAGFAAYDLGGVDTPRAPGVPRDETHPLWNLYVFKRGFGAEAVEYVPAHEYAANPVVGLAWRLARRLRR